MSYFFAWAEPQEEFLKTQHRAETFSIFSFILSHGEGEAAILRLNVGSFSQTTKRQCFFWRTNIEEKTQLLFSGELINAPFQKSDYTWDLEFRAVIQSAQLKKLCKQLGTAYKETVAFFYPEMSWYDPAIVLESHAGLIEFDRVTGESTFAPLTQGAQNFSVTDIFKDSVIIKITHLPFQVVDVEMRAKFTQKDSGEVNISPYLAQAFSSHFVSTYTDKSFIKSFPKVGAKLGAKRGRSGCRVVEAELREVVPPTTGVLSMYPHYSQPFWIENEANEWREISLKRHWFKAHLVVEWSYAQRRKETVNFSLCEEKNGGKMSSHRKKLTCELRGIPERKTHSFIKSEEGERALDYAVNKAFVHFQTSQRCVEISFDIPLEQGFDLMTYGAIDISPLLKKKNSIFAKIISYQWIHTSNTRVCRVRTALSFGEFAFAQEKTLYNDQIIKNKEVFCEDYVLERPYFLQNLEKLQPKGIKSTEILHTSVLIENIVIKNDSAAQEKLMETLLEEDPQNILTTLGKHPTECDITLQDLRCTEVLNEVIHLGKIFLYKTAKEGGYAN